MRAAHRLRSCSACVVNLCFAGGTLCSECLRSRARERWLRGLIVACLHAMGCK